MGGPGLSTEPGSRTPEPGTERTTPSSPSVWAQRLAFALRDPSIVHLLGLVVIVVALVAVEYEYLLTALPPGVDSGHWVTTSYSFIGHKHPSEFTTQPLLYPPATFVILGLAVLVTGGPIPAVQLAAGLLLVLYGLSCVHLARRYVRTGPGQFLFLGLAILNGTTLDILFWGGFPNFLAFAVLNEAMIFLLAFARTRGFWEAVAFGSLAGVLYVTHDLTFVIFAVAVALFGLFWVAAEGLAGVRLFLQKGMAIGLGIFAAIVGAYELGAQLLSVGHPGYLFSNPASYAVDPIGIMFRIFYYAPAFTPAGAPLVLSNAVAIGLLLALSGAVILGTLVVVRSGRRRVPIPALIALAWVGATLVVPVTGYLARIDTDYPRFSYFFPLPVALLGVLLAEWGVPILRRRWASSGTARRAAASPSVVRLRPVATSALTAYLGIGAILALLFLTVSVPAIRLSDGNYQYPAHDQEFIAAADWIAHQPGNGAVISDNLASRWVEAITGRNAFASGPTWLHYYQAQILGDDQAYWTLDAHYVATDSKGALAFGGYNDTFNNTLDEFPQYVGYVDGVAVPMLRLAESSLSVSYELPNGSRVTDPYSPAWGMPSFALSASTPSLSARFTEPAFSLNESATLDGSGDGTVSFLVLPTPGVRLENLSFHLATPVFSRFANTLPFQSLTYAGGGAENFSWSVRGSIAALPGEYTETVNGSFSMPPSAAGSFATPAVFPTGLTFTFPGVPSGLSVQMHLASPVWSNPAVTLPPVLDGQAYLAANNIHYLLVQNTPGEAPSEALFAAEYGFSLAFENQEWSVLTR